MSIQILDNGNTIADWVRILKDGKVVYENHYSALNPYGLEELFTSLGIKYTRNKNYDFEEEC